VARVLARSGAALAWVGRVEVGVATAMLAIIVVCIFAQVVSRYGLDRPLVWVEELSTYAFIWGTFVGASAGLKQGRHLTILSFVGRLPPGPRLALRVATDLAIGVFCVLLAVNGVRAMLVFEWSQRTIALPVELPRYLFYSTPLILGAASMTLTVAHDLATVLAGTRTAGETIRTR
jgi:TRAP-type C4-dicarboxylate transport system permease small subunit